MKMGAKYTLQRKYPDSIPFHILWQRAEAGTCGGTRINLVDESSKILGDYIRVFIYDNRLQVYFHIEETPNCHMGYPMYPIHSRNPLEYRLRSTSYLNLHLTVMRNKLIGWYYNKDGLKINILCSNITIEKIENNYTIVK